MEICWRPLAAMRKIVKVRDHHPEVRITMLIIFMYIISILGVPEAQDGDWGHVGVSGAGVVGPRGPGPPP
jgi:hypothetical protein